MNNSVIFISTIIGISYFFIGCARIERNENINNTSVDIPKNQNLNQYPPIAEEEVIRVQISYLNVLSKINEKFSEYTQVGSDENKLHEDNNLLIDLENNLKEFEEDSLSYIETLSNYKNFEKENLELATNQLKKYIEANLEDYLNMYIAICDNDIELRNNIKNELNTNMIWLKNFLDLIEETSDSSYDISTFA